MFCSWLIARRYELCQIALPLRHGRFRAADLFALLLNGSRLLELLGLIGLRVGLLLQIISDGVRLDLLGHNLPHPHRRSPAVGFSDGIYGRGQLVGNPDKLLV